jgi:tungstate transport system substrate-binding protein
MSRQNLSVISIVIFALILVRCSGKTSNENAPETAERADIILATTTSTQDSGLLDLLLPIFQENNGYLVKTVAVGTGKALKMAEEGNADVLLVHAPAAEKELMESGFGKERFLLMHNDFVIVGPPGDPAMVAGLNSTDEALARISNSGSSFVSRGDDSGTHKQELALWNEANIEPAGEWYLESGQGMGASLKIASEKSAYTLADRGTYFALRENLDLVVFVEGHPSLLNVYHVILVNPDIWPNVNYEGASAFAKFLTSAEIQTLIGEFGIDRFGQPLFTPDAGKSDAELGLN